MAHTTMTRRERLNDLVSAQSTIGTLASRLRRTRRLSTSELDSFCRDLLQTIDVLRRVTMALQDDRARRGDAGGER